jgi:RimJ/RimL family protein N-acetyltransferase
MKKLNKASFFLRGGAFMELYHHGIPGQKWGVRNGPPYPLKGSHDNIQVKDIQSILSTLSKKERRHVLGSQKYSDSKYSCYRKVIKIKGKPAGFIEAFRDPDLKPNEAIVISAVGKNYRGQKLATKMVQDLVENPPKGIDILYWETTKDNPASAKAALTAGFKKAPDYNNDDDNYIYIVRRQK